MKKILLLHGFSASGSCPLAVTLKEVFDGKIEVIAPDLPLHPNEALNLIHNICDKEQPDMLVGNSCGSFYAQMFAPIVGVPALLGNPHFEMTKFLAERKGHFKGNLYRFEHTAFDSETQERMVVYQALYGEKAFWVRPEKMFFEKVTRDGKTFNRFLETEI